MVDYLLGGVPTEDLEYMRKNLSPVALHLDMMHYAGKVKLFSLCIFRLIVFSFFFFLSLYRPDSVFVDRGSYGGLYLEIQI